MDLCGFLPRFIPPGSLLKTPCYYNRKFLIFDICFKNDLNTIQSQPDPRRNERWMATHLIDFILYLLAFPLSFC